MQWLFDSSEFFTRNHCGGGWTPELICLSRLANFLIFLAYCSIPFSLFVLWWNLKQLRLGHKLTRQVEKISGQNKWILLLFGCFIITCGLTHLDDVIVFDYAPYRYFTSMEVLTSVFSISTALLLPLVARRILQGLSEECEEK
jgi:amino acid transporter